jgi:REP element-mobilizing transposase RayT
VAYIGRSRLSGGLPRNKRIFRAKVTICLMAYSEHRLPHWDVIGQPLFVTFRLHGSLPARRQFRPAHMTSGQAFAAMDGILDRAATGPKFRQIPEIAALILECLKHAAEQLKRYELHSYVIMPNHVHILVTPSVTAQKWLGPLKGFSAFKANRILGRTGPFWQNESYDHLVKDRDGFDRIKRYIENNPVKAGLCTSTADFPWSSVQRD